MKKLLLSLALLACLITFGSTADAAVLTFDDITTSRYTTIQDGYGGLNWDNANVLNASLDRYDNSGYETAIKSPSYIVYNSYADDLTISGALFNVKTAFIAAAWNVGLNVTAQGFRDGELLYEKTFVVDNESRKKVRFRFKEIDTLIFSSYGGTDNSGLGSGTHFALDNFKYNLVVQNPEPSTMVLMGIALLGLVGIRRRITRA